MNWNGIDVTVQFNVLRITYPHRSLIWEGELRTGHPVLFLNIAGFCGIQSDPKC